MSINSARVSEVWPAAIPEPLPIKGTCTPGSWKSPFPQRHDHPHITVIRRIEYHGIVEQITLLESFDDSSYTAVNFGYAGTVSPPPFTYSSLRVRPSAIGGDTSA